MKKLSSIITVVTLALFNSLNLQAQAGAGATYIGDYSKMSSRSVMDKEMENGNWAYRMKNLKGGKYDLTVTMMDGSVKQVKSKIYADSLKNKSYLIFTETNGQSRKIYTGETSKISAVGSNGIIDGFVTDSCWLFPVVKGKINAYSFFPATGSPFSLLAIQMGNSPVISFSPQLIEAYVKGDDKAYRYYLKKDYWKSIIQFNDSTAQIN
jgi:hypothetical protein